MRAEWLLFFRPFVISARKKEAVEKYYYLLTSRASPKINHTLKFFPIFSEDIMES